MFGPKWMEVTGGWRKLHNEELRMAAACQILIGWLIQEDTGRVCNRLVCVQDGLGGTMLIKRHYKVTGWEGVDRIDVAQGRNRGKLL
jgi:hypothetical protein